MWKKTRGIEGGSSANVVQKQNFQPHKFKNKGKFDGKNKAVQHMNFKKNNDKKNSVCHVCGDPDHWAPSCPTMTSVILGKAARPLMLSLETLT